MKKIYIVFVDYGLHGENWEIVGVYNTRKKANKKTLDYPFDEIWIEEQEVK